MKVHFIIWRLGGFYPKLFNRFELLTLDKNLIYLTQGLYANGGSWNVPYGTYFCTLRVKYEVRKHSCLECKDLSTLVIIISMEHVSTDNEEYGSPEIRITFTNMGIISVPVDFKKSEKREYTEETGKAGLLGISLFGISPYG